MAGGVEIEIPFNIVTVLIFRVSKKVFGVKKKQPPAGGCFLTMVISKTVLFPVEKG
jgi:hypothetical protein